MTRKCSKVTPRYVSYYSHFPCLQESECVKFNGKCARKVKAARNMDHGSRLSAGVHWPRWPATVPREHLEVCLKFKPLAWLT